jgi:hypothetical protein
LELAANGALTLGAEGAITIQRIAPCRPRTREDPVRRR